eukprot:6428232-Karenia_brevis.AAC.1
MKTARQKLRGVRAFREAIGREYRAQAAAQAGLQLNDFLASRIDLVGHQFQPLSLEEYAKQYVTRGEKAVACLMHSRLSDTFYGQWLLLHIPWRHVSDFEHDKVKLVPVEHRNLARLMMCPHPDTARFKSDTDALRHDMTVEGRKQRYQESVLNYLRAHTALIDDYLQGNLEMNLSSGTCPSGLIRPDK